MINWKSIQSKLFWWATGVLTGLVLSADILFARSIDMSKAGVSIWVFFAVGGFIIMLQLVPAIIVFSSLIASLHKMMKVQDKEVKEPVAETSCCKE